MQCLVKGKRKKKKKKRKNRQELFKYRKLCITYMQQNQKAQTSKSNINLLLWSSKHMHQENQKGHNVAWSLSFE